MQTANSETVSEKLAPFLRDVDGALGADFLGAILFGSHASRKAHAESDVDLAVVVADLNADRSRNEVHRAFNESGLNPRDVALNVESYRRIKDFLRLGDPFAWTVITEGKILAERSGLLSRLKDESPQLLHASQTPAAVSQYLFGKCSSHYDLAMDAFRQFLSHAQISVMAGAQASVAKSQQKIAPQDLTKLSDWNYLKGLLVGLGATRQEIESAEALTLAHKKLRQPDGAALGKDILEKMQTVGELWRRLSSQHPDATKNPVGRPA